MLASAPGTPGGRGSPEYSGRREGLAGHRRIELEQVVQTGQDQEEPELLVGAAEHHRLGALGSTALDQHQGAESGRIDLTGRGEVDHQPSAALGEAIEKGDRLLAEV